MMFDDASAHDAFVNQISQDVDEITAFDLDGLPPRFVHHEILQSAAKQAADRVEV